MVLLGKRHLQAAFKGVGSDDIVYTIDVSEGKPKHGEVVLASTPADGPAEGWRPAPADERGLTATTSFTQQDVNDGAVWYRHFGGDTNADSFLFRQASPSGSGGSERQGRDQNHGGQRRTTDTNKYQHK
ncbi:Extracellular matrix protein FRAS1 [Liparis tanakae]|uniref:Extracellular matrix protein FRAS1 n=1 Tax=Liparis tanakae TaxID=230148 RepID=A0A4Z2G0T8_9TELE|nr:Extracellular matrix protein FRAS1 [Liparis tanakae]